MNIEKEPKISVIIPVYNTQKYIKKCLESLANQTLQDFEIIVVNDGSTDNSKQIIKEFQNQKKIKNFIYVEKENGGLSDARNFGVKKATGKYITFLDSDDYIDKDLYKNLQKSMDEDADLIKFKMQTVNEQGKIIDKLDGPVFEKCTGEEALEKLCGQDNFLEVACIYLYKREFFINNKFKYTVGTYHEDFGLTPLVIAQAKSVISTNEFGYYYLQTDNSIMRNTDYKKNIKKSNDVLIHYDNAIEKIANLNIQNKTKDLLRRYYTNSTILKAEELKGEDFENYIKKLQERKMYKNIKSYNIKQFIKRTVLKTNIKLYLKMR